MSLPTWWRGATIKGKAEFLVRTGQARDFAEACAELARRRKQPKPKTLPVAARLPYRDD